MDIWGGLSDEEIGELYRLVDERVKNFHLDNEHKGETIEIKTKDDDK